MVSEKDVTSQDVKGQVILYKNHLEVRLEKDTVWLTAINVLPRLYSFAFCKKQAFYWTRTDANALTIMHLSP